MCMDEKSVCLHHSTHDKTNLFIARARRAPSQAYGDTLGLHRAGRNLLRRAGLAAAAVTPRLPAQSGESVRQNT